MASFDIHTTVADLVSERPSRSRVFEELGIDYRCGGKRSLAEVRAERGLDAQTLIDTLAADTTVTADGQEGLDRRFTSADELIDYIVDVHHGYLRRELPRFSELGAHVVSLHADLEHDMHEHVHKENNILFPMVIEG